MTSELGTAFGLPLLDGVAAAVKPLEGLSALELRTSEIGGYAPPLAKTCRGDFDRFAPETTPDVKGGSRV